MSVEVSVFFLRPAILKSSVFYKQTRGKSHFKMAGSHLNIYSVEFSEQRPGEKENICKEIKQVVDRRV